MGFAKFRNANSQKHMSIVGSRRQGQDFGILGFDISGIPKTRNCGISALETSKFRKKAAVTKDRVTYTGISTFRTPGVRRAKEGCSWGCKVPNREIPKNVWKNKSQDIFGVSAYWGSRRQRTGQLRIVKSRNAKSRKGVREGKAPGYFGIRRFGHPGDRKSGNSTLKVPKREIEKKGIREGKAPGYFGVSATGSWGDKQLKDSYTEVPNSQSVKGRSREVEIRKIPNREVPKSLQITHRKQVNTKFLHNSFSLSVLIKFFKDGHV